eukprot:1619491-Pyramimonas_sp.AAC.1
MEVQEDHAYQQGRRSSYQLTRVPSPHGHRAPQTGRAIIKLLRCLMQARATDKDSDHHNAPSNIE